MPKSSYKPSKFSLVTSLYLSAASVVLIGVFLKLIGEINFYLLFGFGIIIFLFSFWIIKFRVEKFIFSRVNKIYNELDMVEAQIGKTNLVNTDMEMLTEQVKSYATKRRTELESLKVRDEYRKEFLGNVSHELKTPLFTIQGYILTLLDGAMKKPELCEKYLTRASKGVERLNYIIQDLDMITKLEIGDLHLDYEDFDIVSLIENVFELFEIKANKKNITLTLDRHYEDPILVTADKERIQQVLANLVVNSIKYGKEDGTTEVSIEQLVDSKMIVRITDNGEGIKKENIARLFERFYRVDKSRSRDEGGSGLGLAIVKHIVEAHKEHIYTESVYGIGSEFSFTLEKAAQETEVTVD